MNGPRTPVESLRKGLILLELLCDAGGSGGAALADIAGRMGWKRTSTHNLLKTLRLCGYASNDGEGRYTAGWRVADLTRRLTAAEALRPELVQLLAGLAAEVDEAVVLTTMADTRRRVLARARGTQAVQVDAGALETGKICLWETVTGRILAAFCSPAELDAVIAREGFPGKLWGGIAGRASLDVGLAKLRSSQLAESHARDVVSFARPVRAPSGELLGAIGMYLPEYRCDPAKREKMIGVLTRAAERMGLLWWNGSGRNRNAGG